MTGHRESLRYRFDLLASGLLLVLTLAGCVALRVVQQAEGLTLDAIARASVLQLLLMFGGLLGLLCLALLVRRMVTTPLRHMIEQTSAMAKSGRLVRLPVAGANELRAFAESFNDLVQQVEEQKRRMREHVVELQEVSTELDRLASLKDDFLMTISHQFRTPLTALVEGLELMQDGAMGPMNDEQRSLVHVMDENVSRLDHLIEEALDLSLIKSGRRLLDRKPWDVRPMLQGCVQEWQAAAESRTITLACEALPRVYMDGEAIREVIGHLLRNALRHAPPKSEITVRAQAKDDAVEISVRDRGPGMAQEHLAKLFEPFVHVQTPDAPGSQGSGLGLAICRQVIDRHRGRIEADSALGQGMTVTFALPIATPNFLLEETFRCAREDAEYETGHVGLLLVTPLSSVTAPIIEEALRRAELALRRNTHRGDRFVRVDERTLVILAVADQAGLAAMAGRLRGVVQRTEPDVALATALYPLDGDTAEQLVACARRRASEPQPQEPHATMGYPGVPGTPRGPDRAARPSETGTRGAA